MLTVIKNVYPVFEDSVAKKCVSIIIENGIITDVNFENQIPDRAEVIDGKNGYCLAGFIDLHVHGGGGADFMDETVEAFKTVTDTHLKHGTTTLVPTSMTASEEDLIKFVKNFNEFKKSGNSKVTLPGVHLEGPYFAGANSKSAGAQKVSLLREPDENEIDHILNAADGSIIRWDAAPELKNIEMFLHKMKQNGILSAVAHSNATGNEAMKGFENGFAHVTHFYNAVTTYRKVEQNVLAGVVEAAYLNDFVTLELICDGKHIPKECLLLAIKIKGAEKVAAITDAMRIAGTDLKKGKLGSLKSGTDVIVDDGVAKLSDLTSFAGSIATMDRCLKVLVDDYKIPLNVASIMLSGAPARRLNIFNNVGSIENGKVADLVFVDNDLKIQNVFKSGKIVV